MLAFSPSLGLLAVLDRFLLFAASEIDGKVRQWKTSI
jgi:hypothetical protein